MGVVKKNKIRVFFVILANTPPPWIVIARSLRRGNPSSVFSILDRYARKLAAMPDGLLASLAPAGSSSQAPTLKQACVHVTSFLAMTQRKNAYIPAALNLQ